MLSLELEENRAFERGIGVFRIFVGYCGNTKFHSLSNIKSIPKYAITSTYYVGLDVHKETISIAYALAGSREDATYHGQCSGSITSAKKCPPKAGGKT